MVKIARSLASAAAVMVVATSASAQLVKQITIDADKAISFYLGSQQGTAKFATQAGACLLAVTIAPAASNAGMSGMAGGMAGGAVVTGTVISVPVAPARPARVATPDGQQLVFNCGPDGTKMFLDMPSDFKVNDK